MLQGITDKAKTMRELCESLGLELSQKAYVGDDDNNDLEVPRMVGLSGAPADAIAEVRASVHHLCQRKGGEGCLRELVNLVLA